MTLWAYYFQPDHSHSFYFVLDIHRYPGIVILFGISVINRAKKIMSVKYELLYNKNAFEIILNIKILRKIIIRFKFI